MLIIFIAIISTYALLPHILTSAISTAKAGLHVDKLTVSQLATYHIEIPHARLTTANGTTTYLERLSVDYSISQIASGTAKSISVQQIVEVFMA